ncbi:polysaccharide lyase family 7 protein [Catenulispora pinisilvae]|uniref:polysaccharide lyase family 7 protein n=1 Tax=Catenulispora pinisilvae TaxID=2705253 RepID=UPI001E6393CA|nr:polysaccharide lyase family 7 protein [Catenulispora pinisilvae]
MHRWLHPQNKPTAPASLRRPVAAVAAGALGAALSLTGATLALAPAASAATTTATTGPVTGYQGLCLDDRGAVTTNLNPVQVYTCNGTNAQQWSADSATNTLQVLGKCLDVNSAGTVNGTTVDLYDCNGTGAQQWVPQSNGELLNPNSGKCLDDTGSGGSGTQVQIWSCTDAANQKWAPPTGGGSGGGGLNTSVAPGGNFDLSVWELQEPTGSAGSPTTIAPGQLEGANGYQDSYFYTDSGDGAMTFWDPENGVTTPNSNYSRSELREMNSDGSAANWFAAGTTNTLGATLKVTQVPDHVCVGQIHLGSGGSTKPLLELFYYANGDIKMAIEQTPAGGNEVLTDVGNVPVGTQWSYVIGLSGSTISLSLNGGAAQTWTASSTFDGYGMYFKAGDYDQSSGSDSSVGAKVGFYALSISHG